ncbi:MAG: prephenate dehydrogenase [Bacteroidetes bacterium]|nr:prephenate dehydrogenase [Bacteroidota bacterium]
MTTLTVIGAGLIGGSLALDLKECGFADVVLGVDTNMLHADMAQQLKLVDEIVTLDEGVERGDLIVLTTPINVIKQLLPDILTAIKPNQVVTDMGSTKGSVAEVVREHPNRQQFVLSHPMAGTEYSGPTAAKSGLFDGKAAIICDADESDVNAVDLIRRMYEAIGMHVMYMNSVNHDLSAAYVSHISHITSFALALTVLEKERDEKTIANLASGGFASTVRLAKSSADMWVPIFEQNATNVLEVIDTYIEKMQAFRQGIADNNLVEVYRLIREANKIQKILK